jgi:hypothetical protein
MDDKLMTPTDSLSQSEANKFRDEAKCLLHEQFCIMGRNDREAVERIVDCIIAAAVFQFAAATSAMP